VAKPRIKKIVPRVVKVAIAATKKVAKTQEVVKKKTKKAAKSAVGLGKAPKRTRQATRGDIFRKGISNLKKANAALARFIALRYSPKAIAKYQDYAGRLRRSKRLIKQIVEIDDATFRIKGYIIRTDTAGNNPYSCTCPDFSQFSTDNRDWLRSKAGPFNPCKHMMAVRDRQKGKWVCSGGVCTLNPLATEGYATRALCNASRKISPVIGGQSPTIYQYIYEFEVFRISTNETLFIEVVDNPASRVQGPVRTRENNTGLSEWYLFGACTAEGFQRLLAQTTSSLFGMRNRKLTCRRLDGLPDTGGNPQPNCAGETGGCTNPSSINYDPLATFDNGTCSISGCTDPSAFNYNPLAICDDGSCIESIYGCTDPSADNYNPSANTDDGSCTYPIIYGCTDPIAANYDPLADTDDGSCTY
jgi:hypothetical protein